MPDLERVLRSTPYTVQQQWYEDGVAVDPGAVTVTVTRSDGSSVATGSATGTGTAPRSFNLTTTHTALLDTLTVVWASSTKGTLVSYVEVVGGFLFTLAQARTLAPLSNTTTYTTAAITDMRTLVEQAMEDAAGVAFVPRYELETLDAFGSGLLLTKWPKVTAIRTVTLDTATVTPADVTALRYGALYYTGWAAGYGNVTVGYEHGYTTPPERVRRAALFEARYRLIQANSPTDDRAVRLDTDVGSYALQQPGRGGMLFYLPETDAAVAQYSMTVGVA